MQRKLAGKFVNHILYQIVYYPSSSHRWKTAGTSGLYVVLSTNERGITRVCSQPLCLIDLGGVLPLSKHVCAVCAISVHQRMYCSHWCLLWLLSDSAQCLHFSFHPSFYYPHTLSGLAHSWLLFFNQIFFFFFCHLIVWIGNVEVGFTLGDFFFFFLFLDLMLRFFQWLPGTIWVLN